MSNREPANGTSTATAFRENSRRTSIGPPFPRLENTRESTCPLLVETVDLKLQVAADCVRNRTQARDELRQR